MGWCSAYGCKSGYDKHKTAENVPMHQIPINDELLLKKWLHKISRQNFIPTKTSKLCSMRTEPQCDSFVLRKSDVAKEWRHKRAEPTSRCRDVIESAAATPKLQMPAAREPSALWPPFLVWRHNRSRVVSCPIYVAASQKTSRWSDRTRFGPPSARLTRFLRCFFARRRRGPAPRACRVSLSWRCQTTSYRRSKTSRRPRDARGDFPAPNRVTNELTWRRRPTRDVDFKKFCFVFFFFTSIYWTRSTKVFVF